MPLKNRISVPADADVGCGYEIGKLEGTPKCIMMTLLPVKKVVIGVLVPVHKEKDISMSNLYEYLMMIFLEHKTPHFK